jgi:hypothetical protein
MGKFIYSCARINGDNFKIIDYTPELKHISETSNLKEKLNYEKLIRESKIKKLLVILKLKYKDCENILTNTNKHENLLEVLTKIMSALKVFNNNHKSLDLALNNFTQDLPENTLLTIKKRYNKNLECLDNIINYLEKVTNVSPIKTNLNTKSLCFCCSKIDK